MSGQAPERLQVEGVTEFWFRPDDEKSDASSLVYRAALLIECSINFRSLRAGLNHSEERSYTAWLPEGELAIDWDSPAVVFEGRPQLTNEPEGNISHRLANYRVTRADLEEYEAEFIDRLVRNERLRVYFNPVFGL